MRGLIWYLIKRILSVFLVVLLVASAVFLVFFIAGGDPSPTILPNEAGSPELRERITNDLKLNEPVLSQYVNFMAKTLSGKFFVSIGVDKGATTSSFIYDSLWKTLALFAAVLIPALLVGLVLGWLFSGRRESMFLSRFARLVSLGLASVSIVSAALLLYYYYAKAEIMPPRDSIIPPLIVSFPIAAGTYILVMKGKERHFGTIWKTAASVSDKPVPATSITKLYVAWVMVVVLGAETLWGYGGVGLLTWDSFMTRDVTLLMACIFLVVVTVAFTNFALDIISPFIKSWLSQRQEPGARESPTVVDEATHSPDIRQNTGNAGFLRTVARDYIRSPLGVFALIIVLAILVIGALAPILATVPNPERPINLEPTVISENRINPMSPSFDRSPNTGFLHPLGTDVRGRDVYSELLYGARAPLILISILAITSLAVGALVWIAAIYASRLERTSAILLGGLSSVVADFVIATPLFVMLAARSYPEGLTNTSVLLLLGSLILVVWACTFRIVRVKMQSIRRLWTGQLTPGHERPKLRVLFIESAGSIIYVSKFVVLFGFLTLIAIQFFVPVSGTIFETSWAGLSEEAFAYSLFALGSWWLIVPQLVLAALLVGGAYKALDSLEQVMVRRFGTL